ncbi:hypothetical protein TELCIR_17762 [Teladorsagia circumcincta]|uniref:Uncharacterized protein n=1 Tax=Teladorsagia circumcincta TaxID=45464 RepID=A0A2G9TS21_TELCI|nr:hypothetical protein TELCIR_17762 [Teladorsagia circumcincta]
MFTNTPKASKCFSLQKLCVAGCGIERILIADNQFPSLTTLNIKENVISEVIIAKLSGLVDLNRFDVSAVERQSAEVRFLDKYFSTDDSVRADHVDDIERLKKVGRVFSVGLLNVSLELDKGTHKVKLENPMRTLDFYSPEPDDILNLVAV